MTDDSRYYTDLFFAFQKAVSEWPKMPKPLVLKHLKGKFPEDWQRGQLLQNEIGIEAIPPKTECEIGAGFWDRITEGKWRGSIDPGTRP